MNTTVRWTPGSSSNRYMTAQQPASPALSDIIAYLDDVLQPDAFQDYGRNGLQVPGAAAGVRCVATGVSGHLAFLQGARAAAAQLALVHHPISFDLRPGIVDDVVKRRLKL